jgi:hypothetical protein
MRLLTTFGATGAATLKVAKTSIYFNELNEKINQKIRTPNALR